MTAATEPSPCGTKSKRRECAGCGCLLSTYNHDELCAACTRTRGAPVGELPRVPDWVWADPDVRQALADFDFGQVSKLVRHLGSIRQENLAQLTGLSQGFLSMLESGARQLTSIDRIIEFLDGLNVPAELVRIPRRGTLVQPREDASPP